MYSADTSPFIILILKRLSRASQCEIEAFWRKSLARAEAVEERKSREV
jgi:hypothetical protein